MRRDATSGYRAARAIAALAAIATLAAGCGGAGAAVPATGAPAAIGPGDADPRLGDPGHDASDPGHGAEDGGDAQHGGGSGDAGSDGHGSYSGDAGHGPGAGIDLDDRVAAQLATAAYQDVDAAVAAGYASTVDTLGCFQDPDAGGMGVHYLNEGLLDAELDLAHPEALVYELDGRGAITGLVAHEYIVPTEAWTEEGPPSLDGLELHRHPTLPLWVLHIWLWKDNPAGVLADWNPAVRLCPPGVPVFGVDLPADGTEGATEPPVTTPPDRISGPR